MTLTASQLNVSQPKTYIVFHTTSPGFGQRVPRFTSEILRLSSCFPGFVLKLFVLLCVPQIWIASHPLADEFKADVLDTLKPIQPKPIQAKWIPHKSIKFKSRCTQINPDRLKLTQVHPSQPSQCNSTNALCSCRALSSGP